MSLLSLSPPLPNTKCIAYNFDGTSFGFNHKDILRYTDGGEIPNINDYLGWTNFFFIIIISYFVFKYNI
jgi:hypothetical protein